MALRPEDRYGSPRALAEDVERWLADEPVSCYREPLHAELSRWVRTHKPVAAGAAALLLTAVVALSAGIFLVGREQRKTERQRRVAVQQGVLVSEKAAVLRRRDAVSRVNLAYREYLDDNVALADLLLDGCESGLRDWEWDFARRVGHSELDTFVGSSLGEDVWAVALSPDGELVATAAGPWSYPGDRPTGELVVRSVRTGQQFFSLPGLKGAVQAVSFSPDGRRLAAAWGFTGQGDGAKLAVFEVARWQKLWEKSERAVQVLSLAYSPDGRSIASGCGSFTDAGKVGFARIRDAATGEAIGPEISGGPGGVLSVAISHDGRQVVLASRDVADICDLSSPRREIVHRLRGHANFIYAAAFSPDGRSVATGGWDKTIRIWDRGTGTLVRNPGRPSRLRQEPGVFSRWRPARIGKRRQERAAMGPWLGRRNDRVSRTQGHRPLRGLRPRRSLRRLGKSGRHRQALAGGGARRPGDFP